MTRAGSNGSFPPAASYPAASADAIGGSPATRCPLSQAQGKERYIGRRAGELSQAFALSVPHEETARIRDEVAFFQTVRAAMSKRTEGEVRPEEDLDLAVRQIISRAVASEGVLDGLRSRGAGEAGHRSTLGRVPRGGATPAAPQRRRRTCSRSCCAANSLSAAARTSCRRAPSARCWRQTLCRYRNRAIEAPQVIEELIQLATRRRCGRPPRAGRLSASRTTNWAFYDALGVNRQR